MSYEQNSRNIQTKVLTKEELTDSIRICLYNNKDFR